MEYSRKVAPTDGTLPVPVPVVDGRLMDFGSVFLASASKSELLEASLSSGSGEQPQGINVADMLVVRGLATVVKHREFEERSNFYDSLLSAESRAQKGKKGLHSGKATPAVHINDLSIPVRIFHLSFVCLNHLCNSHTSLLRILGPIFWKLRIVQDLKLLMWTYSCYLCCTNSLNAYLQGTASKARNFLPFLQKSRRLPAIVDYVLSGHRFKILIPKETCAIAFSLSGVRCPARGDKYSEEAITFMRQKIMQRDVEVIYMPRISCECMSKVASVCSCSCFDVKLHASCSYLVHFIT